MGCFMSMYPGTDKYREKPYSSISKSLKTGDAVLFSGSEWTSWIIRIGTFSPWSHTGMVVITDKFSKSGSKKIYLWHSPRQKITFTKDAITKRHKSGPQLNDLKEMVAHRSGSVYIRSLKHETKPLGDPFRHGHQKFFVLNAEKEYERDYLELFNSQYDGPYGENEEDASSYFCSELLADTYREMDCMRNPLIPSNEFVPADFSSGKSYHLCAPYGRNSFRLTGNMKWGVETEIV